MANIVLKNRSNEEQTYEGVEAVVLNTDTGETATFVGENLIPEPYVHPDTHPASMITGLAKVATSGDYNHLANKPCYQSPRLESSSLTFSKDDEMGDYGATVEGFFQLEVGDSYTVNWDGTDYACTVKDPSEQGIGIGMLYLGNLQRFWNSGLGEDTGEPFVLAVSNDDCTKLSIETNQEGSHTVALTPAKAVHPLGAEYLPESAATKSWVQSQISTGGGGGGIPNRIIFPEQEVIAYDGFVQTLFSGIVQSWFLSEWDSITVTFDGTVYTLTPWRIEEDGLNIKGVGYVKSEGIGNDPDCPFYMVDFPVDTACTMVVMGVNEDVGEATHRISIAVPVTAENTYVPYYDGRDYLTLGVDKEPYTTADGETLFILPWLDYGAPFYFTFTYQDGDQTYPMTVVIRDFVKGKDDAYMAAVPFVDANRRQLLFVLNMFTDIDIYIDVVEIAGNTTATAGTT